MGEDSVELQSVSHSESDLLRRKLDLWNGEKNINPLTLGVAVENAGRISQRFQERVLAETDVGRIVDGIIPADILFNPDRLLRYITTPAGQVEIVRVGKARRDLENIILKLLRGEVATAIYDPNTRRIFITPILDAFSTTAAVAKGDLRNVVGIDLAHEALHAHQESERKPVDKARSAEFLQGARAIQRSDPRLSLIEAMGLEGSSRDLTILIETQAHILHFMLTGGDFPPDIILTLKSTAAQSGKTEAQQLLINNVPLSRYSENGYGPIIDLVVENVKTCLPKKDQDENKYLDRIRCACLQIIRLLGSGVSHIQIANLIKDNYQAIHSGGQWDEENQRYSFLQPSVDRSSTAGQMDDAALLESFNKQNEERVMKIRAIAREALMMG